MNKVFTQEIDQFLFKKLCPSEYFSKELSQTGKRSDGRGLTEGRKVKIDVGTFSTADASSMVRIGNTVVACGIKLEVTQSNNCKEGELEGILVINMDLPPLCSAEYKVGPPDNVAQHLTSQLDEIYREAVDLKSLVAVKNSNVVWCLYADVVCLNDDGSLLSAATTALSAAFSSLRLPEAIVDKNDELVRIVSEPKIPLKMFSIPIGCSFGYFEGDQSVENGERKLVYDLVEFEESLLSTVGNIVMSQDGSILFSQINGLCKKEELKNVSELFKNEYNKIINLF